VKKKIRSRLSSIAVCKTTAANNSSKHVQLLESDQKLLKPRKNGYIQLSTAKNS